MANIQQSNLFTVPIWRLKVDKFKDKKLKLQKLFSKFKEEENIYAKFETNKILTRTLTPNTVIGEFAEIIQDELHEFQQTLKKDFSINDVWSVSYAENAHHPIHSHGSTGLSGILYLDLPIDSPYTTYVQSWNDAESDCTIYNNLNVLEGDITIVPSYVLHYSSPNKSKEIKRIISWDMKYV